MGDAPCPAVPKALCGTVASASVVLLALGCGGIEVEFNALGRDSGSDARRDSTRPIDGAGGDRAADRGEKDAAPDGNVDSGAPTQGTTKVADAMKPQSIAISPTNVYWTEGDRKGKGAVMSIPRAGAGAPAPVPGGSGLTGPLVVKYSPSGDGTFLAWSAFRARGRWLQWIRHARERAVCGGANGAGDRPVTPGESRSTPTTSTGRP